MGLEMLGTEKTGVREGKQTAEDGECVSHSALENEAQPKQKISEPVPEVWRADDPRTFCTCLGLSEARKLHVAQADWETGICQKFLDVVDGSVCW